MMPPSTKTAMAFRAPLVTFALFLPVLIVSAVDPLICRAVWVFNVPCTEPRSAVVNQVQAWSTHKCYDSTDECTYEITKEMPGFIEIKHTYLSTQKITTLNFTYKPPAAPTFCSMRGLATAAPPAGASPYCLLHNLVNASGLTQVAGYKEICNAAMCPSVQLASCITKV